LVSASSHFITVKSTHIYLLWLEEFVYVVEQVQKFRSCGYIFANACSGFYIPDCTYFLTKSIGARISAYRFYVVQNEELFVLTFH
jgi:hypothetical protein